MDIFDKEHEQKPWWACYPPPKKKKIPVIKVLIFIIFLDVQVMPLLSGQPGPAGRQAGKKQGRIQWEGRLQPQTSVTLFKNLFKWLKQAQNQGVSFEWDLCEFL